MICHAQSNANAQGICQGQRFETELSELGVKQTNELVKSLQSCLVDKIVSSPAKCCLQTTEVLGRLFAKTVQEEPLLAEMNQGQWEGKSEEELFRSFPEEVKLWKEKPSDVVIPEGESIIDISARVQKWFEGIDKLNGEAKNCIFAISHDVIIRTILVKLLRRPLDDIWMFQLDNAGVTRIEWGQYPQVVEINQNKHLEGLKS